MKIDDFYKDVRYSDFRPQNRPKKRDLLTIDEIKRSGGKDRRVLEIGASSGYILRQLPDCEKHAVELSINAAQYLTAQGITTVQPEFNESKQHLGHILLGRDTQSASVVVYSTCIQA